MSIAERFGVFLEFFRQHEIYISFDNCHRDVTAKVSGPNYKHKGVITYQSDSDNAFKHAIETANDMYNEGIS